MVTDRERLRFVRENRPSWTRGVGRTYAACHNVAEWAWKATNGDTAIWFIPNHIWLDHILPMLDRVLTEYGLQVGKQVNFQRTKQQVLFHFCGKHVRLLFKRPDRMDNLRGLVDYTEIDDYGECSEAYFYSRLPFLIS